VPASTDQVEVSGAAFVPICVKVHGSTPRKRIGRHSNSLWPKRFHFRYKICRPGRWPKSASSPAVQTSATNTGTNYSQRALVGRALPIVSKASPQLARRNTDILNPVDTPGPSTLPAGTPVVAGADAGARGAAEVLDTATLWVRGRKIQLEGILADEDRRVVRPLARFLRRREVICAPSGAAERYRCSVEGQDLSEVIFEQRRGPCNSGCTGRIACG